ncbi:MAG: hypothetical protein ACE5FD_18345, partial [Anaerolineae bacterium]
MYPAINIGSFVLPTAAFVYLVGVWFSLGLVERTARLLKQDPEKMYGTAVSGVVAGLVGARLVFVM